MTTFAIGLIIISALPALIVPAAWSLHVAAGASVTIGILVHVEMDPAVLATYLLALVAVNVVGLLRSRVRLRRPQGPLLAFLIVFSAPYFAVVDDFVGLAYALLGFASTMAVATTASSLGSSSVDVLYRSAIVLAPVLFLLSISEVIFGSNAVWPRRDGITYRIEGANNLIPWVDGRAMATTGYAITLGLVAAALMALTLLRWLRTRSKVALLASILLFSVVLFSGTRSALVGLFCVGLAWLLANRSLRWALPPLIILTAAGLVVLVAWVAGSQQLLGSDSFAHRSRILQSVSDLLERPVHEILFGGGFAAVQNLFERGGLVGVAGIQVTDNDYLRIWIALGAIGLVFFVLSGLVGVKNVTLEVRGVAIILLVGALLYDVTTWRSLFTMLIFVLAARSSVPVFSTRAGLGVGVSSEGPGEIARTGRARDPR